MRTAIVTSETSSNHDTGLGHPENADRVDAIINNLKKIKSYFGKNQLSSIVILLILHIHQNM